MPDEERLRSLFSDPDKVIQYHDLLAGRGVDWGLIGPHERDRLWDRHVLNSVALADLLPRGVSMIDVGSGAGLPGIPLALARPDLRIVLLEPLQRRADFLELAVEELALDAVDVVRARAEDHRERYDTVTGRAVAPLKKLVPWTAHLGPELVFLKGASAADEVRAAAGVLARHRLGAEVLSVRADAASEPTTVVRLRRGSTAAGTSLRDPPSQPRSHR